MASYQFPIGSISLECPNTLSGFWVFFDSFKFVVNLPPPLKIVVVQYSSIPLRSRSVVHSPLF